MKYNFLPIAFSVAALIVSCKSKQPEDNAVAADTTVIRDTVVQTVVQPVDTAAIIAAYEAEYAKTKSKNTKPVYKAKAEKQVTAYPEPEIQSVAPATETIDVTLPACRNFNGCDWGTMVRLMCSHAPLKGSEKDCPGQTHF